MSGSGPILGIVMILKPTIGMVHIEFGPNIMLGLKKQENHLMIMRIGLLEEPIGNNLRISLILGKKK
ncbi:MAG TPA: hypothetical protein ENH97_01295 [bacterium]|nr:hypothetical protein [bacterium]